MSNLVFEADTSKRPAFSLPDELTRKIEALLRVQRDNADPSWNAWASIARDLGQECAKRCWVYPGPSEQEDPPDGGTPVAVRMAA